MTERRTTAHAATQPDRDRQDLVSRLKESREAYLRVVGSVDPRASAFRPAEGCWSILECAEHVAVAERQMLTMWVKLAAPGQTDRGVDHRIASGIADRRRKDVAPERSRPTGRYTTLAEAIRDFASNRDNTIAYLESYTEDLRSMTVAHPLVGTIDGYQLFLLMAGHAERHAAQIEEIQGHPAYPGRARSQS